jgi:hypothetical protein
MDPKPRSTGSFAQAPDLTPSAGSPLSGRARASARTPVNDAAGKKRPSAPAIGALEP